MQTAVTVLRDVHGPGLWEAALDPPKSGAAFLRWLAGAARGSDRLLELRCVLLVGAGAG